MLNGTSTLPLNPRRLLAHEKGNVKSFSKSNGIKSDLSFIHLAIYGSLQGCVLIAGKWRIVASDVFRFRSCMSTTTRIRSYFETEMTFFGSKKNRNDIQGLALFISPKKLLLESDFQYPQKINKNSQVE